MPRRPCRLADGTRVTDAISVGVLTKTYPLAKIRAVLEETKRTSIRNRAMPAHVTFYYVLAMTLCMEMASREVLRWLLEGIRWLLHPSVYATTGKSGITQARQRLGWEPLKRLHDEMVRPVAQPETHGAWYRSWRIVSLDGSTLSVADTVENERTWGRAGCGRGAAGYPSLRFVSLVENGTHVLFATELGRYHDGEITLAYDVVRALRPGMLCLADREFLGCKLWQAACAQGSDLLWRAKKVPLLPCEQRLPDGSYLSHLYPCQGDRKKRTNGVPVRVIEYRLSGVSGSESRYRLVTTILDPQQAPARELAALYHERWEIETALDEFKTHLRGPRLVLRSKTPDLVRQEFYALLLTHFAIRGLMHEAALMADEDPDRLSFVHAVRVIRRKVVPFAISPSGRTNRIAPCRAPRDSGAAGREQPRQTNPSRSKADENQVSASSPSTVQEGDIRHSCLHSSA